MNDTLKHLKKASLLVLAPLLSLSIGCAKPSVRYVETALPPTPCLLPALPSPRADVTTLRDCDDLGPGTDACMSQDDLVTILIFLKQLDAWTALALECPGVQIIKPKLDPVSVKPPTDERKQI